MAIEAKHQRVNEQILAPQVRVIGADGVQLGILPIAEALELARQAELDLVEVAPNEHPPVCRIMDYGKYKYLQKKRLHKSLAQHHIKLKEIRLRPQTGEHDVNVKLSHARDFLTRRHKVQITVMFRGRELAHKEEGKRMLEEVLARLADVGKVEHPPQEQGKRIVCTLAPLTSK
ncbi:MAG: translation initiation factor IF-3 [Thermoguttaceae bacterium]|nr:translation initiation factor IF-3 [Thermoguttaceae bacterium]MDW8037676.1 translation initiation factor IF-3 [Thermoguttaceae bacterium]